MSKSFLPAYVFLYTDKTVKGFRNATHTSSQKFLIDVQNSAPPFEKIECNAWLTPDGKKIAFENGSVQAIVRIVYAELLAHVAFVTGAQISHGNSKEPETSDAWK